MDCHIFSQDTGLGLVTVVWTQLGKLNATTDHGGR